MNSFRIGRLTCDCVPLEGTHICYLLTPVRLNTKWLELWSKRYATAVVAIHGIDWDNDLTPWAVPGVEPGEPDFEGNASGFLAFLCTVVLPEVEASLHLGISAERGLIGFSLSGLFALWTWMNCDDFIHIGCISGSFWCDGFTEWLNRMPKPHKKGGAYFSLADKERVEGNPRFCTVVAETASVVRILRAAGIITLFDSTAGTHFAPVHPRLEKALIGLTQLITSEKVCRYGCGNV